MLDDVAAANLTAATLFDWMKVFRGEIVRDECHVAFVYINIPSVHFIAKSNKGIASLDKIVGWNNNQWSF